MIGAFALVAMLVATLPLGPMVASAAPPGGAVAKGAGSPSPSHVVPGSYIVRFAAGVEPSARAAEMKTRGGAFAGASVEHTYRSVFPGAAMRLSVEAADALRRDPKVLSVEPDQVLSLDSTQLGAPWGLDRADQRNLPLSGNYTYGGTGAGVTAYIVDSGIRASHVDFGGRVRSGFTAFDDGYGTTGCQGHGTHVAGSVGGSTYGMAKQVSLVAVRVFPCVGQGSTSALLAGLDWIAADHLPGTAAVANLSLGFPGVVPSVDAAVEVLIADGVTVVVAAGNDGIDACGVTPARVPGAVTVGATDRWDYSPNWSNYSSCLDLFAPGVSIASSWNTSDTAAAVSDGTSMAAPHVAGAAAVLLGANPTFTPAWVSAALVAAATTGVVTNGRSGSPNRLLYSAAVAPVAPSNDPFTAATGFSLTGINARKGSNASATTEPGEPDHASSPSGSSVWWKFTAPASGTVTLSTQGSSFDTLLAAYTGLSVNSLIEVAANDDTGSGTTSAVSFPVTPGVTYRVAVAGYNAAMGAVTLLHTWTPDTPAVGSLFTALTPARILDSRAATTVGPYSSAWGSGMQRTVPVGGVGGVPADAVSVVLNVTVTGTTAASYLTLWPSGESRPNASSLNWSPGTTHANAVTVKLGTAGAVSVFNAVGNAHVVIDVAGYYKVGTGGGFTALTPARILDSRAATTVGPYSSAWGSGMQRTVPVAGVGGVPADAVSVVLNVTVTGTTAASYLTLWPAGVSRPNASSLNWSSGATRANAVTVKLGTAGAVSVFNAAGNTNVVIDVAGYFKTGSGKAFYPLEPTRILDSRPSSQVGVYPTAWTAGATRAVSVAGSLGGFPATGTSVVLNVTVTGTTASSYLTVWATGQARPTASSLNWSAGATIPNAVTAKLGVDGAVSMFNAVGSANIVADVAGYYA